MDIVSVFSCSMLDVTCRPSADAIARMKQPCVLLLFGSFRFSIDKDSILARTNERLSIRLI